jgi:hypothetical protein
VFSVGAAPRLYNEDLRQLRDRTELSSRVPSDRELSSAKISEKRWQLQQRIGLRVPELTVGR